MNCSQLWQRAFWNVHVPSLTSVAASHAGPSVALFRLRLALGHLRVALQTMQQMDSVSAVTARYVGATGLVMG